MTSITVIEPRTRTTKPRGSNSKTPRRRRQRKGDREAMPETIENESAKVPYWEQVLDTFDVFLEGKASSILSLCSPCQNEKSPLGTWVCTEDTATAASTPSESSFISQYNGDGKIGGCLNGELMCQSKSSVEDFLEGEDRTATSTPAESSFISQDSGDGKVGGCPLLMWSSVYDVVDEKDRGVCTEIKAISIPAESSFISQYSGDSKFRGCLNGELMRQCKSSVDYFDLMDSNLEEWRVGVQGKNVNNDMNDILCSWQEKV